MCMLLRLFQIQAEKINKREGINSPIGELDIKYFVPIDCVNGIKGECSIYSLSGQEGFWRPYRKLAKILRVKGIAAVSVTEERVVIIKPNRGRLEAVILKDDSEIRDKESIQYM